MSKESVEQAAGKLYPKPKAVVIPDDYYNEDFCKKTMEMEMLQSAFIEGAKWKSSPPDAAKEQEAVDDKFEFAEWAGQNYSRLHGVWVHRYNDQTKKENWMTTDDVYKMFLYHKELGRRFGINKQTK